MSSDARVQALRDLTHSLQEFPADQPADLLAEVSNLASRLKGLADVEMLTRALVAEGVVSR